MALELMRGNEAVAEGAIRAGCRFYTGYPITPQNELFEYMAKRMPQAEGTFLQCESEVAGINMIWGAACTGPTGGDDVQPRSRLIRHNDLVGVGELLAEPRVHHGRVQGTSPEIGRVPA